MAAFCLCVYCFVCFLQWEHCGFVSLDTSVRSYDMRSVKIHYRKVYIYDANFMYSNSKFVYYNNMSQIQFFLIIIKYSYIFYL